MNSPDSQSETHNQRPSASSPEAPPERSPGGHSFSILFIGGGNMAQAMIGGLLQSEVLSQVSIQVVEPDAANRQTLLARHGSRVAVFASSEALGWLTEDRPPVSDETKTPDWIILAVKPQQAEEALHPVATKRTGAIKKTCLLSIAAGVTVQSLQAWSGLEAIVRTMPNTPAMVQQGITGAYAVPGLSATARSQADLILRCLGSVVWLSTEDLLDAVTAVSGSGPAYVFYFLEAFAAAGERLGLPAHDSHRLALQTMKGAITLLEHSGETPAALRAKVTSKGGTTAAALGVLQSDPGGLVTLMNEALRAAHRRAQELSHQQLA